MISKTLADNKKQNNNHNINDFSINTTVCEECLHKNIYLPEYQYKYSRINELNDTNFNFNRIKSNRSVTLVPENLIDGIEKQLEIDRITDIINKIEKTNNHTKKNKKNQNDIYSEDYSFYSNGNQKMNYKYIKKNTLIYGKSSSSIKDLIVTNYEEIKFESEICKPKTLLFKIINPNSEDNLIIKGIKTDLYQVKVFPFISNKNMEKNNNNIESLTPSIESFLDYTIYPQSSFIFQLLFLMDHKTTLKGTMYIEFNEKKVLLVPILLTGRENIHKINPIYYPNHQVKKIFYYPLKIFNPTAKTMIITEIIHSFEKIEVYWPNDEIFNNNVSTVKPSMLKVGPMSTKRLFYLKWYSSKNNNEYGFIHIRTEKNVIVVPVLVNIVNSPIITYPTFLNFGLCDVTPKSRNNFIRMIPLKILNDGIEYIKLGKVYIDYDELFLQFHQNFGGESIVIKPNKQVIFGYFIFNSNLEKNLEKKLMQKTNFFGKIIKKIIYIETNSTAKPLVEVDYSYVPFLNNELQEINGNIQSFRKNESNFSFITNLIFKKPIHLRIYSIYKPGENITIYCDKFMTAKMLNPSNEYQTYNSNITIEIFRLDKFKTNHYYYFPIRLNDLLFTIIPIQIDNDYLTILYCGDEDNSRTLSVCKKNFRYENEIQTIQGNITQNKIYNINFGNVSQNTKIQKFIYLINENESPIYINNIIFENQSRNFFIDIEGYEYFGNKDEPSNIKYPKKGFLYEKLQNFANNESITFKIFPNTAVKLSINLITHENQKSGSLKNKVTIYYGDEYKFILLLNTTIIKGNINLSPIVFKFEPSFPGLYQKKIVYSKSSFNFPLNILSVSSNDERIIPHLLTDKISPKNKTALIQVDFNPSKTYFIKVDNFELNMSNILTYKELYLWKLKEKFFNKLGSTGRTEINANVTITTSIDRGEINFKSFLIKPNLAKKEEINFGLTQIGKSVNIYIEGINPSDKMLLIKLVLAEDYYADVNNNSMFKEKDRNLLEKNIDLMIFECNFIIVVNDTTKSKYEYIVVPEKINPIELRKGTFDKKQLLTILYKYGNEKVKKYLYNAKNILCKYEKKIQNDIIFNKNRKNNYLVSQIYSSDFSDEIPSVKNMTKKNISEENKYKFVEKKSFFNSILTYLFNLYIKYFMKMSLHSNINIIENTQSFFIPNEIQEKIYQVPPHKKYTVGPIIFKPSKKGTIKGTLFLKNNLTILYPLKLLGEGGGGHIKFIDYYRGRKKTKLYNEKNFVIEIDEAIYEKEIKGSDKFNRTITIMNYGNLPMTIKNMTIDDTQDTKECQTNILRIVQCKEFTLNPQEMVDIDIEITPNFRNTASNGIIYFNTKYQSFFLNVIIILSSDFYETKNYLWIFIRCSVIIFTIVSIMLYSLAKIIDLVQKHRREICDKDSSEAEIRDINEEQKENLIKNDSENNSNENEQLEYKNISPGNNNNNSNANGNNINYNSYNNYHQNKNKKQGKKKKNRKKSNSSYNQKEEAEQVNNNNNNNNSNNINTNYNNNEKKKENRNNYLDNIKEEEKVEKINKNKNIYENSTKTEEENYEEINNKNIEDKKEDIQETTIKNSINNESEKKKINIIPHIDISKAKKRKINKGQQNIEIKSKTKDNDNESKNETENEKEILSDRREIKRDIINKNFSAEKKNKKSCKNKNSIDEIIKSNESKKAQYKNNDIENENEVSETNNNYYNNIHKNKYYNNIFKKGGRKEQKKYFPNNRRYNNYDSNQNTTGYNHYQQQPQPKKNITTMKRDKNAKNLKELFEIENSKRNEIKETETNAKKTKKIIENEPKTENISNINNLNNIITNENNNNISSIKISNDEGIEDDFTEELNYQLPIIDTKFGEKSKEMSQPSFWNDIKQNTNNIFEPEQDLKQENGKDINNKNNLGELSKEDSEIDFSSSQNFNVFFFEKEPQQQENEEPENNGNYEDYRFKFLFENLNNNESNFYNEDKNRFDSMANNSSNNIKEESEDKKEENENEDSFKVNDYMQYELNKIKFDSKFNYFGLEINNEKIDDIKNP